MILWDLLFLCRLNIFESETFVVFTTFFTTLIIWALNIEVPTIPILEASTIKENVFFWLLFPKNYRRRNFFSQ